MIGNGQAEEECIVYTAVGRRQGSKDVTSEPPLQGSAGQDCLRQLGGS